MNKLINIKNILNYSKEKIKSISKNKSYQNSKNKFRMAFSFFILLNFLFLVNCPKNLPTAELSEAKLQLGLIEEEGLVKVSGQEYENAKKDLLDANESYASEKYDDAKQKAINSIKSSISIRLRELPITIENISKKVEDAVEKLNINDSKIQTNATETKKDEENQELAEKSNTEKINELVNKAKDYRTQAENNNQKAKDLKDLDKFKVDKETLNLYHSALVNYKNAQQLIDKSERFTAAGSVELEELLKILQNDLDKAKKYGATNEQLKSPRNLFKKATLAFKKNDFTKATKLVDELRKNLDLLLADLEKKYAKKLNEQAKATVAKTELAIQKFNKKTKNKNKVKDSLENKKSENTGNSENVAKSDNTENSENVAKPENAENSENVVKSESSESTTKSENSENVAKSESSENIENSENVAKSRKSESSNNLNETKEELKETEKESSIVEQPKEDISKATENIDTQIAAAKEAVQSSTNFLEQENYKDSIKESEDAIRLCSVVLEQYNLVAKGSKSIISSDGNGLIEEIGNGWKRYTVRDRKPADCLWCIAANPQIYGNGLLWGRIHKANLKRVKNPARIYPRQVLLIPPQNGEIGRIPEEELYSKSRSSEEDTDKNIINQPDPTIPEKNDKVDSENSDAQKEKGLDNGEAKDIEKIPENSIENNKEGNSETESTESGRDDKADKLNEDKDLNAQPQNSDQTSPNNSNDVNSENQINQEKSLEKTQENSQEKSLEKSQEVKSLPNTQEQELNKSDKGGVNVAPIPSENAPTQNKEKSENNEEQKNEGLNNSSDSQNSTNEADNEANSNINNSKSKKGTKKNSQKEDRIYAKVKVENKEDESTVDIKNPKKGQENEDQVKPLELENNTGEEKSLEKSLENNLENNKDANKNKPESHLENSKLLNSKVLALREFKILPVNIFKWSSKKFSQEEDDSDFLDNDDDDDNFATSDSDIGDEFDNNEDFS